VPYEKVVITFTNLSQLPQVCISKEGWIKGKKEHEYMVSNIRLLLKILILDWYGGIQQKKNKNWNLIWGV